MHAYRGELSRLLGWTPSTFVSSRSDRAKQKIARPEDFMDEEDLQELRDSRNLIDNADEMDLTGGDKGIEVPEKEWVHSFSSVWGTVDLF